MLSGFEPSPRWVPLQLYITRVIFMLFWPLLSPRGAILFPIDDVSRHSLKKERYIVYIYYKTSK